MHALKRCLPEQAARLARAEKDRVVVERAACHRKAGQRVIRVVFDDDDKAAGAGDPPHLGSQSDALRRRHVVEDADRECGVEGGVLPRQGGAVLPSIVHTRMLAAGAS